MLREKEALVLEVVRRNCRASLALMSRLTGIPQSTLHSLLRAIEERAVIKHACLLDFERLGYPLRKRYLLRAKRREELLAFLRECVVVNNLYRTDLVEAYAEACFATAREAEEFRHLLSRRGARPVKILDVLEELKHEEFVPRASPARNS